MAFTRHVTTTLHVRENAIEAMQLRSDEAVLPDEACLVTRSRGAVWMFDRMLVQDWALQTELFQVLALDLRDI